MDYTLTFTEQQMNILNMALGEIPHKHAAPLIQSINEQILKARAEDERIKTEHSKSSA